MQQNQSPRRAWMAFVAIVLAGPTAAMAQNSAIANITATVQQPITVTKTNDLAFGTVYPGINKTIAVSAAGAAAFSISGQTSAANVNITFTLPTTLANGGNTMPIGTWTGYDNTTASATSGGTTFTPSASATTMTLSSGSPGLGYVYVGATVQPTVSQVAGSYTGTLTMTAVYF